MTKPPLKKHHLLVLRALYDLHLSNKDWAYTFAMIGEQCRDGVLKSDVRRIVRFLKRRGYVQYVHCFSEDDYQVNGSGHMITAEGICYLQELPK